MIRSVNNLQDTAAEALQKSAKAAADYKHALEESFIVAATDHKGIINYANDNFCKISKYSREELIGHDHRMVNSGFHSKEFIKNIWTTIAKGEIWRGELKNKAKDGTFYWVDTTIVPFLNAKDKPYEYVAIRNDITSRKETEEILIKSQKETSDYKYALDVGAIVSIVDHNGMTTYVNDNFCKISQFSSQELIGKNLRGIYANFLGQEFMDNIWATITRGEIWRGEVKNEAKDGTIYWTHVTTVPFMDEYGKPYQFLSIRTDITERKRLAELAIANKELAFQNNEKEKRAAEFIIANAELAFQNEEKGKRASELVIANKELAFQNDEKEKRATELIIANAELIFQNQEKENRAAELIVANKELAFQNQEKENRAAELILANMELAFQNEEKENRAAELVVANRELAFQNNEKEKRAEELIESTAQLESANRELESFSYSVSHDLRTPLRAVNGYAKILEEDYGDRLDDEGRRMLTVVQDNAKKMGVLIDDLLTFSRLGRKEIKKSVVNMTALVENALTELNTPHQSEAVVKINDLQPVTADATLMNQVWLNLLSNAIKYSSNNKKPDIKISSERKNGELVYSISDNGVGFDMKYADKLFGVFQRLHSSKDFEGTGVGLALVCRIITRHGGKIWAKGEINKGATFYFSLPEKHQTK
jgi:PAS domain S-box-containing protein